MKFGSRSFPDWARLTWWYLLFVLRRTDGTLAATRTKMEASGTAPMSVMFLLAATSTNMVASRTSCHIMQSRFPLYTSTIANLPDSSELTTPRITKHFVETQSTNDVEMSSGLTAGPVRFNQMVDTSNFLIQPSFIDMFSTITSLPVISNTPSLAITRGAVAVNYSVLPYFITETPALPVFHHIASISLKSIPASEAPRATPAVSSPLSLPMATDVLVESTRPVMNETHYIHEENEQLWPILTSCSTFGVCVLATLVALAVHRVRRQRRRKIRVSSTAVLQFLQPGAPILLPNEVIDSRSEDRNLACRPTVLPFEIVVLHRLENESPSGESARYSTASTESCEHPPAPPYFRRSFGSEDSIFSNAHSF